MVSNRNELSDAVSAELAGEVGEHTLGNLEPVKGKYNWETKEGESLWEVKPTNGRTNYAHMSIEKTDVGYRAEFIEWRGP